MEFFSKAELLAAAQQPQLPAEPVAITIGAVTKSVWVRGMSGTQRDAWETSLVVQRRGRSRIDTANVRARLAVRCLVSAPDGERLFTDADAELIGNLPVSVLNPIYEKAQRLSGVSNEDIDELEKASEPAAGSGSPSNSL